MFGPGASNPDALRELLARCPTLRARARADGVVLDDTPGGLQVLDERLEAWSARSDSGSRLTHEVGCYLGTVIVRHVPGAQWHLWPNGHPVVRTASGRDLDVLAQVGHRVSGHGNTLPGIYAAAADR